MIVIGTEKTIPNKIVKKEEPTNKINDHLTLCRNDIRINGTGKKKSTTVPKIGMYVAVKIIII